MSFVGTQCLAELNDTGRDMLCGTRYRGQQHNRQRVMNGSETSVVGRGEREVEVEAGAEES